MIVRCIFTMPSSINIEVYFRRYNQKCYKLSFYLSIFSGKYLKLNKTEIFRKNFHIQIRTLTVHQNSKSKHTFLYQGKRYCTITLEVPWNANACWFLLKYISVKIPNSSTVQYKYDLYIYYKTNLDFWTLLRPVSKKKSSWFYFSL